MKGDNTFLVRILCLTYNHESYIKDAMSGFAMQGTNFPFVAVIIDDASTDNTSEIISQFMNDQFSMDDSRVTRIDEKDYGRLVFAQHKTNKNCFFAVILLRENHYQKKKSKRVYYQEWQDTKYVAFCEGDDYWTDPDKLQRQVDYMDSHPDCMLTVHSANWQMDEGIYPGGCHDVAPKDFSVEALIRCGGLYFATASFVFRAELCNEWPKWRLIANVGDFPLQILAGLLGNVHYLPEIMCVYRYQSEGSWTFNQKQRDARVAFQKSKIEWMTLLDEQTNHKYQKAIYDQLFPHFHSLYLLREISFGVFFKATHQSGNKRYGRLLKDLILVKLASVHDLWTHVNRLNKN